MNKIITMFLVLTFVSLNAMEQVQSEEPEITPAEYLNQLYANGNSPDQHSLDSDQPVEQSHQSMGAPAFCHICGKDCKTSAALKRHQKNHDEDKPFKCTVCGCGAAYKNRFRLAEHTTTKHSDDRPYPCDYQGCTFTAKNWHQLDYHVRQKHLPKIKCSYCSKKCVNVQQLKRHEMKHTGERPFPCEWAGCPLAFTDKHALERHIRSHTGEKPYRCPCGSFATNNETYLYTHIKKQHRENPKSFLQKYRNAVAATALLTQKSQTVQQSTEPRTFQPVVLIRSCGEDTPQSTAHPANRMSLGYLLNPADESQHPG